MTAITTTLLLPLLGWHPAMSGPQTINVVWVSTPRASWGDTADARLALDAALRWWEARADVAFGTVETTMTTDVDVLTLNVCRDRGRSWLPVTIAGPTLSMVATNGDGLLCDGAPVGDYNEGQRAIVWGLLVRDSPTDQATLAHTLAHLYGAADGPSGDIMDKDVYVDSYRAGIIADSTWMAIGATRRVAGLARRASAAARPRGQARSEMWSYLQNVDDRSFGACRS